MGGDRMGGDRMGGEPSGREPMHEWDERDRGMRREPRMRDDRDERGMREHGMRDERGTREYGMRDERGMRDDPWRGSYGESLGQGEAPIVKVIEVVAQSPHSWEDATRRAVAEASRTIHDIKSVWVKDMQAIVTHDRVVEFRLVAKISFAIRPSSHRGGRDVHA